MSGHTPGPWVLTVRTDDFAGSRVYRLDSVTCLAVWRRANATKKDDANAALISAAPDLLEVLKAVLQALGRQPGVDGYYSEPVHREEVDAARAAIAKAEGKP